MFAGEQGHNPSHLGEWAEWKARLAEANVCDGRLRDAWRTAVRDVLPEDRLARG